MRISDWSSDVCSSDLRPSGRRRSATASPRRTWSSAFRATERLAQRAFNLTHHPVRGRGLTHAALAKRADRRRARRDGEDFGILERAHLAKELIERQEIGRESCRERVCQYV